MKHGGVKIVHLYGVRLDVVGEIIGTAVADAGIHTTASNPDGKAAWVMITAIVFAPEPALAVVRATMIRSPFLDLFCDELGSITTPDTLGRTTLTHHFT